MKTLLVHALRSEASIIRQHFPQAMAPNCDLGVELRHLDTEFDLLRTGIGLEATNHVLSRLPREPRYARIIQFGVSGSLSDDIALGAVVQGTTFLTEAQPAIAIHREPVQGPSIPAMTMYSARKPIMSRADRERLASLGAEVVDMESYALASFCTAQRTPFIAIRAISDLAGEEMEAEFKANFATASETLQRFILKHIMKRI